jgi:hypothetical protein
MSSCVDWFNSNELHYRPCCSSHAWQVAADHVSPSLHNPLCYIIREVKAKRTLGCTRHLVMAEWKLYRRQHCDVWLKVTRRRGSGGVSKIRQIVARETGSVDLCDNTLDDNVLALVSSGV